MIDLIYKSLSDMHFIVGVLFAIAAFATVVTVAMPLLETVTAPAWPVARLATTSR